VTRKNGLRMKKIIVLLISFLLALLLFLATGCNGEDTTEADGLKQSGDEMTSNVGVKLQDIQDIYTPEDNMSESYVESLRSGEPQGKGDMATIEQNYANILSEIEGAREDYQKILKLQGVKDYKSYAKEMLSFLDAVSAWIEASLSMDRDMNEVQTQGPQSLDTTAIANDINNAREQAIENKREASNLYTSAYLIDRDKIHQGTPEAGTGPENIHLSWMESPSQTITVHWETPQWLPGYTPTVEYGTDPANPTDSPVGDSFLPYFGDFEQHEVELLGLDPNTTYYYRCGSPDYGWSDALSFQTTPEGMEGFSFCVIGDTRSSSSESSDVSEWGTIATAASGEKPLFTLLLGDLVYLGFMKGMWPAWFEAGKPLLEEGAVMSSHGNHEQYAMEYFDRFSLPGNERWYSFDISNIHFVCLDSGLMDCYEQPLLEEQTSWLENDLKAASERGQFWTVVFLHRPPYSSGMEGIIREDLLQEWVPIFDRYGIDLVLDSHEHFYQRSYPMMGGRITSVSPDQYRNPGGTIYVLQGCGGAPQSEPIKAEWTASQAEVFCYTIVKVLPDDGTQLEVLTKTADGNVLDRFTLSK
jgi:Purple acid Phosphatase, N-terminal domain/Calcineurin-like phosphoesterase